jgi:hypothetical protein
VLSFRFSPLIAEILVKHSFRMTPAEVVASDAAALRLAILAATGCESGTDSILRSLERMGTDPTIEYFEMSQVSTSRRYGGAAPGAWRVRADRGIEEAASL